MPVRGAKKLLKSDTAAIKFMAENPKKVGSKAGDATRLGTQWQDLSADFEEKKSKKKTLQRCGYESPSQKDSRCARCSPQTVPSAQPRMLFYPALNRGSHQTSWTASVGPSIAVDSEFGGCGATA